MAKIIGGTTTTPMNPAMFGGSGGVVDQTYNPESENAQSGKAVAEAVTNAIGGVNAVLNLIIGGEENADNT